MQGARMQERKNARLISMPYLPFITSLSTLSSHFFITSDSGTPSIRQYSQSSMTPIFLMRWALTHFHASPSILLTYDCGLPTFWAASFCGMCPRSLLSTSRRMMSNRIFIYLSIAAAKLMNFLQYPKLGYTIGTFLAYWGRIVWARKP